MKITLKHILWPWAVIRHLADENEGFDQQVTRLSVANANLRANIEKLSRETFRLGEQVDLLTRTNETTKKVADDRLTELRRIGLRRNAKGQLEKAVW